MSRELKDRREQRTEGQERADHIVPVRRAVGA
jgi:hypothetical protein